MGKFFEKEGSIPGTVALVLFFGWILAIPFIPRPERPRGAQIPDFFVGQLWRLSPGAQIYLDDDQVLLNDSLTEVTVRSTGQRFLVRDLIHSTEHLDVTVLCRSEDFIVCRYGPFVFVVDNRDLIVHIATAYHYRVDGLYPCPEDSGENLLFPAKSPSMRFGSPERTENDKK